MTDNNDLLIAQHEKELQEHERRLSQLENDRTAYFDTQRLVAVILERISSLAEKVDVINSKVDVLESNPGKRWEYVVKAIISGVVGVLIGYMLVKG